MVDKNFENLRQVEARKIVLEKWSKVFLEEFLDVFSFVSDVSLDVCRTVFFLGFFVEEDDNTNFETIYNMLLEGSAGRSEDASLDEGLVRQFFIPARKIVFFAGEYDKVSSEYFGLYDETVESYGDGKVDHSEVESAVALLSSQRYFYHKQIYDNLIVVRDFLNEYYVPVDLRSALFAIQNTLDSAVYFYRETSVYDEYKEVQYSNKELKILNSFSDSIRSKKVVLGNRKSGLPTKLSFDDRALQDFDLSLDEIKDNLHLEGGSSFYDGVEAGDIVSDEKTYSNMMFDDVEEMSDFEDIVGESSGKRERVGLVKKRIIDMSRDDSEDEKGEVDLPEYKTASYGPGPTKFFSPVIEDDEDEKVYSLYEMEPEASHSKKSGDDTLTISDDSVDSSVVIDDSKTVDVSVDGDGGEDSEMFSMEEKIKELNSNKTLSKREGKEGGNFLSQGSSKNSSRSPYSSDRVWFSPNDSLGDLNEILLLESAEDAVKYNMIIQNLVAKSEGKGAGRLSFDPKRNDGFLPLTVNFGSLPHVFRTNVIYDIIAYRTNVLPSDVIIVF